MTYNAFSAWILHIFLLSSSKNLKDEFINIYCLEREDSYRKIDHIRDQTIRQELNIFNILHKIGETKQI